MSSIIIKTLAINAPSIIHFAEILSKIFESRILPNIREIDPTTRIILVSNSD